MNKQLDVTSVEKMIELGCKIGARTRGGEVFELSGDVGTGKTSFVKGLAAGMGIADVIQSPTFTISRMYDLPNGIVLGHYDFYRLKEPGIMRDELSEILADGSSIVALEWDETVKDILPRDRTISVQIKYTGESSRSLTLTGDDAMEYVLAELEQ